MLMICSSRARNRSPDPIVSYLFHRIAPSDAATESRLANSRNSSKRNCKLSGPQILKPCNLKTIGDSKSDSPVKGLQVVHGQRKTRLAVMRLSTIPRTSCGRLRRWLPPAPPANPLSVGWDSGRDLDRCQDDALHPTPHDGKAIVQEGRRGNNNRDPSSRSGIPAMADHGEAEGQADRLREE